MKRDEGAGLGAGCHGRALAGTLLAALPPGPPPGAPCRRRHRSRPPRAAAARSGLVGPAATHPAAAPWPGAGRAGGRARASCGAAEPARGGAGRGRAGRERVASRPRRRGPGPGRGGARPGMPAAQPGGGARGTGPRRPGEAPRRADGAKTLPPATHSQRSTGGEPGGQKAEGALHLPCPLQPQFPRLNTDVYFFFFFLQNVFIFLGTEK